MMVIPSRLTGIVLSAIVLTSAPVTAQYLSSCPAPAPQFWPELRSLPPEVIQIEADDIEAIPGEIVRARGGVRLFADGRRVDSEAVDFLIPSQTVEVLGQTRLFDGDFLLQAGAGRYRIDEEQGEFQDIAYWLQSLRARGSAELAAREGPGQVSLRGGSFTTCPEGNDSWWLHADRIRLDQESGRGHGYGVKLRFKDVPILYTPYINFPLDDRRQSGILTPAGGYSSKSGVDLAVPWYWNIAPNYDATLTPRLLSNRGLMLDTEWRYLRPRMSGQVDLAVLPNDRLADEDRYLARLQHRSALAPGLSLVVDATKVSDQNYFQDFGSSVFVTSTAVVERRADLIYDRPNVRLTGRVQDYESLDPTLPPAQEPYRRLPQILLEAGQSRDSGVFWDLRSELVQFDRPDSATGLRFDLEPELGFRHDTGAYFVEPRIGLRYTSYNLDDVQPGTDRDATRTLPHASIDGGLIFERWLGDGSLQTLEPRVFYGYVPFRDQDGIPLFDTAEREFSFDSLFTTRRFVGADRVGDTHQITTALTSRIIDSGTGVERLSVSAGQITYLDDRRVRLRPSDPTLQENRSELAAEALARFGSGWQSRASVIFDTGRDRARLTTLSAAYSPHRRALLNLSYRFREDRIEQTDISGFWPLSERIQVIGRWNYSLFDESTLELLGGLEYRSCCYGVRVVLRRYLTDSEGEYNNAIYFQLTLDGLGRLDTGLDDLLREGITGYDTYDYR
jgi:LPS-assembly protein